jgi:YD repeat-containing protein
MGNWIHFVFDAEANSGGGLESPMPPDVGGSSGFPSLYLPYGDGRIAPKIFDPSETAPWVRQTDRNLQLILINQEEPEEPEDRIDIDNIEFFVIRDADGPQYHYWPDGRLVYVDFNWRNNYLGDIPDYLRVIWSEGAYAKGTNEEVPALDRVIAANGGYLRFNHPTGEVPGVGSNETFAHVESISYFPFGAGAGPGSINVANYEYRANGENTGRLWRSWPTNSDTAGVQYDYGAGVYESTPNTVTFYENNFQWSNVQELAGISQITPTGTPGAPDVKPLVFLSGYGDDSVMVFIHDPPADPEEDEPWRHAFEIDESLQVKWHDGDGYYGQYSPSLTKGESYLLSSFSYDAVRAIYTDANDEPPGLQKIFYDQPDSEMTNRLIESTKVYAGFAGLATEEMAAFAALTTLLMPAAVQPTPTAWVISEEVDHYDAIAGYGRVTEIRRYAEYEQDGENYVPVENATFTTTLDYGSTEPAITALGVPWPEKIDLPGGARLLLSYTDDGRPTTVQEQILIDTQYVTVATTTYDYFEGDFETLLQSVTVEIENGPSQTIEFTYTTSGPPDNFMPGRLRTVTVDDEVTTFTFNSLGNLIRLETEEGEIEYQYAYGVHPPRLDKVIDAEGVETTLDYDDLGRVASLTIADGLALEKTTTYEYDHHWNVSKVATPDGAETEFAYDIYGQLVRLIDAEGTVFNYSYDEFGRVYREEVTDGPEGDVQYSIDYKYVSGDGSGGTGCGTCAGGAFQIAERTITYGEDPEESETLYYTYDLLGRLRSENSDPESPEIIYTYDGLNLASIEHAGDAELYGDSTLRFEYDDSNRLVREIYPNGRYIEYSYDDSQRLAAVKDPFGFITTLTYDDDEDGRLDAIAHSTIGVATFEYNSDDLLSKLTLGNGAYTTYAYDAYFRLTAFDTYDASESRLIKHDWSYDDLGRKKEGGTGGGVNVTGETNLTKIAFEYDAAGRLAYEDYNGGYWDVDYDYDDAGNRTLRRLMALGETDEYDISYGAANRESSLDGNWEYQIQDFDGALEYDFKGNVLTRVPLADAQLESIANYEYTWDSRDRMRRVDRSGTFSAFYDYDAGGRMLRRRVGLSGGPYAPAELHYWLGLNRLATEAGGDAQAVLRPSSGANYSGLDPEPGDEPGDDGWSLPAWTSSPDDGVLEYVNDADRGRVLKFSTEASGPVDDTFLIGEPDSLGWNPIDEEFEITDRNVFSIWVRNANTSQKFYIIALVRTWDGDATYTDRYMMFRTESGTDFENSPWLGYYIGGSYNDNEWHYLEFDLEA